MSTSYAIPLWEQASLAIVGSTQRFPIRRVFCVGRNYVEHQKEMGGDGKEAPFFFMKSAHAVIPAAEGQGVTIHYAPKTENFHWETELVAVLGKGGFRVPKEKANDLVWGYAVGQDMTRRDLQQWGKDHGRPWTFGKDFDESAPIGPVTPASKSGHPTTGKLWLKVNNEMRQETDVSMMISNIPEQIEYLSQFYTLEAGDIIMTGTPAGVGKCKAGDVLVCGVEGFGELKITIAAAK